MQFKELNENEYTSFALNHPYASFQQTPEMMKVKQMEGRKTCYLGVVKDDEIVAASCFTQLPVMKTFTYLYANRGILMDYEDDELVHFYLEELKKYGHKINALYCRIDPNVQLIQRDLLGNVVEGGFDNHSLVQKMIQNGCRYCGETIGFDMRSQVRFMFNLNLKGKDALTLLKEMDSRTRWSIRKSQEFNVSIREIAIDELDIFKKIMNHTAQRNGFTDRDMTYYQNMKKAFGDKFKILIAELDPQELCQKLQAKENTFMQEEKELMDKETLTKKQKARLIEVREILQGTRKHLKETQELFSDGKKQVLSGASFITTGKEVVYLSAGSYDKYMHYYGVFAIHWTMIQWALEHGYERYNFYGISGNFDENSEDYGIYEFKKGFNGVVEEYVGDFILEMNPMFKVYNKMKKIV